MQESVTDPLVLPTDSLLVQTMASCHSLVKIEGELTGYPMDIKLFDAIKWVRTVALNILKMIFLLGTDGAETQRF